VCGADDERAAQHRHETGAEILALQPEYGSPWVARYRISDAGTSSTYAASRKPVLSRPLVSYDSVVNKIGATWLPRPS
jgi:hypothetical protein